MDDEDGGDDDEPAVATPGDEFASMLATLYLESKLSAQSVCLLSYYATEAGMRGPANRFAAKPGKSTGDYSRLLSKALDFQAVDKRMYTIRVPGHTKHDLARAVHEVVALPPHEALDEELRDHPELVERLDTMTAGQEWARNYADHPMVRGAPGPSPFPVAFYLDGVPYSTTDGVIGFWVTNLVSGQRHLSLCIRKRILCRCGCKGWCSIHPILSWLAWSFAAMARGRHPSERHDGKPWSEQDTPRASQAGAPLRRRYVVCHIKGDWAEFAGTLGFPAWNDALRPCFKCNASADELHDYAEVSALSLPWRLTRQADYLAACARAERRVVVSSVAERDALLAALFYDKRSDGASGRCLRAAIPAFGLEAGDRLEPSDGLPDVSALDTAADFPLQLVFWRRSEETASRHRNPIFDGPAGVTVELLSVDTLHTLNLGVMKHYFKHLFWELVAVDAWGTLLAREDERVALSVLQLRARLVDWYRERARANPEENVTRLGDLTVKMLGRRDAPSLKTKAAETWGLVLFSQTLLAEHGGSLPARARWAAAGEALIAYMAICKGSPRNLPPGALQARGRRWWWRFSSCCCCWRWSWRWCWCWRGWWRWRGWRCCFAAAVAVASVLLLLLLLMPLLLLLLLLLLLPLPLLLLLLLLPLLLLLRFLPLLLLLLLMLLLILSWPQLSCCSWRRRWRWCGGGRKRWRLCQR